MLCNNFHSLSPQLFQLLIPDIHRHSATQWVRGRGKNWEPQDRDQGPVFLFLATYHFGQLIVFLRCIELNCLSLNIRLNWWELVQGKPFALSWIKILSTVKTLFSTVLQVWVRNVTSDRPALPRLIPDLSHDLTIASVAHLPTKLNDSVIWSEWGFQPGVPVRGQQNVAECLLTCLSGCNQITPSQHFLHWLPTKFREAWSQHTWVLQLWTDRHKIGAIRSSRISVSYAFAIKGDRKSLDFLYLCL